MKKQRVNFKRIAIVIGKALVMGVCLLVIESFLEMSIWHRIKSAPDRTLNFQKGENSITWIGHATTLVHINGVNILTDPMYSNFILFVAKRYVAPGIKFENLPTVDAICISHEHYEHMDITTLKKFPRKTPIIIAPGLGEKLRSRGFSDVRELETWQNTEVRRVKIISVPAQHSTRFARGYVIDGSATVYFAGDTGYFSGLKEIGSRFDIDVALLPISHYRTRYGNRRVDRMLRRIHMGPHNIPDAIVDLSTKFVIPIHHSTFRNVGVWEPPLEVPVRHLREIIVKHKLAEEVMILQHGEKFIIPCGK